MDAESLTRSSAVRMRVLPFAGGAVVSLMSDSRFGAVLTRLPAQSRHVALEQQTVNAGDDAAGCGQVLEAPAVFRKPG